VVTAHGPIAGEMAICYRVLSRYTGLVAISDGQRTKGPRHGLGGPGLQRHPGG
jgi:hypothetical protein